MKLAEGGRQVAIDPYHEGHTRKTGTLVPT
jgi:hypothetical protein